MIVVEVSGLMIRSYCSLDKISYDQVIVVEVALGRDRRETVSLEQHQSCSCQCKVKVMMMMPMMMQMMMRTSYLLPLRTNIDELLCPC